MEFQSHSNQITFFSLKEIFHPFFPGPLLFSVWLCAQKTGLCRLHHLVFSCPLDYWLAFVCRKLREKSHHTYLVRPLPLSPRSHNMAGIALFCSQQLPQDAALIGFCSNAFTPQHLRLWDIGDCCYFWAVCTSLQLVVSSHTVHISIRKVTQSLFSPLVVPPVFLLGL